MSEKVYEFFKKKLLGDTKIYIGSTDFFFLDLSSEINENTKDIQKVFTNKYYYSNNKELCSDAEKMGFMTNNKGIDVLDIEGIFNVIWTGNALGKYDIDKQKGIWKKILYSLNSNGYISGSYEYGNDVYLDGTYFASENFIRQIALQNDLLLTDLWISENEEGNTFINFIIKKDF